MLFQPKIILKQILISTTGMDTRTSKHSSVIAIFHVSQNLVWFYVGEKGFWWFDSKPIYAVYQCDRYKWLI